MSQNNGTIMENNQHDSTEAVGTMEVVTVDDFTYGCENGVAYILFQQNQHPKTLIKLSPTMAYELGQTLQDSVPIALLDMSADSFSTNGRELPSAVKTVKSDKTSNDPAKRAELYEQLQDHPLAGLIGLFEECDAEDVSTNVHKYIGEYHMERYAR